MTNKVFPDRNDNDLIICRCEGVTLGMLRTAIRQSEARTVNETKKLTRVGMGLCQGRTCSLLVAHILSVEAQVSPGMEPYRSRPPVRNISLGVLATMADQFEKPVGGVNAAVLWGLSERAVTLSLESEDDD